VQCSTDRGGGPPPRERLWATDDRSSGSIRYVQPRSRGQRPASALLARCSSAQRSASVWVTGAVPPGAWRSALRPTVMSERRPGAAGRERGQQPPRGPADDVDEANTHLILRSWAGVDGAVSKDQHAGHRSTGRGVGRRALGVHLPTPQGETRAGHVRGDLLAADGPRRTRVHARRGDRIALSGMSAAVAGVPRSSGCCGVEHADGRCSAVWPVCSLIERALCLPNLGPRSLAQTGSCLVGVG
jgi:hypothetical protein